MDIFFTKLIICLLTIFILHIFAFSIAAEVQTHPLSKVSFQNEKLLIHVKASPLKQILDKIHKECQVKISGLKQRNNEVITFISKEGDLHDVLRNFLQYLGEKNFAFVYFGQKLKRISVFPGIKGEIPVPPAPEYKEEKKEEKLIRVVRVSSVVENSQAEDLGLIPDDLIIEYDGIKISGAHELVKEVLKKSPDEQVEMIVVRNNELMRFTLNGGYIGVRIKTIKISEEEYNKYFP